MDYLKWQCPSCKQSLEAPADMAGEDIECPTCKRRILIWAATKTNTLNEAGGFGNATPQSSADEIVYAGFWRRAFAVLFDLSLLHLACYAPLFVLGFILPSRMLDALVQLLNFAPIQLVCLHYPYFTGYECSRYQATLGKQLFGIMVQTKDGHPMSGAQATGRYWAKILSALPLMAGFIIVAFDKKKQGFHDKIVGATVIRGWPNGEKRKELPVWLLALTVTGVCSIDGGLFFYNNEHFFVNEPFLVRLCGGILSAAAVYGWILFVLICVVMAIQKRRQIQLEKRRTITG